MLVLENTSLLVRIIIQWIVMPCPIKEHYNDNNNNNNNHDNVYGAVTMT